MKLINILLLGVLSLGSFSAFAQKKPVQMNLNPTLHANEKGNGGQYAQINEFGIAADFLRIRNELIQFLKSDTALKLYPNVNLGRTINLLENDQTFELTQKGLVDKFSLKRDALKFPKSLKVFLEQESFAKAMGTKAVYVLLLHEVFGLQGIEVNKVESLDIAYKESMKIWSKISLANTFKLKKEIDLDYGVSALNICEIMEEHDSATSTQNNVVKCLMENYGYFSADALKVCETIVRHDSATSTQNRTIDCLRTIRDRSFKKKTLKLCHKIARQDRATSTQYKAIRCLKVIGKEIK